MNNISFKKTKFRLTLFFSLIVFFITIFLWFFYFSFKFYNTYSNQKIIFNQSVLENTKILNNQLKIWEIFWIRRPDFELKKRNNWPFWPKNNLNFVVIDKTFENIIYDNIYQNISIDHDLYVLDFWKTYLIDNYFITKRQINSLTKNYQVYFFDKQVYGFIDYFKDLFLFLILSFAFSFVVFYIWSLFVEKILAPIKQTLWDLNDFIHNANHELKTPLSVISSNLQLALKLKIYDEDLIKNSILEINKSSNLITVLSELSDIKNIENKQNINFKTEFEFIIWEFKNKIDEKNITLNLNYINDFDLEINKNYFHILFSNLLWNAIKYNLENNWIINIEVSKDYFSIENTWEWIEKDDLEKIFDRFYKTDKSRNSDGFWIWLSLVKKICDVYFWKIDVVSNINSKTKFKIFFK